MSPPGGKSVFSKLHGLFPTNINHLRPIITVLFFCGVGATLSVLSSFRHLLLNPDIEVNRMANKAERKKYNFKLLFKDPEVEDRMPVRLLKNGGIRIYGVNDEQEETTAS